MRASKSSTESSRRSMSKLIFINLPVSKLERATSFYEAIGADKNEQFSDDTASCMVLSDTIHAMLLTHDKFRQFTSKKIANAREVTEEIGRASCRERVCQYV